MLAITIGARVNAQVVSFQQFEETQNQWLVNGNETLVNDGQGVSGQYIELPIGDFFGLTLTSNRASTGLTGNLNRWPRGLKISFDIRTFLFNNFNNQPIDPNSRPLILHLHDRDDPNNFSDDAGIWTTNAPIPGPQEGWKHREFTIPLANATALPPGWGGTGGEDPVTFEPLLPPGRTYTNVLASVDDVEISTYQPGYFYGFSFWHIGIDNVKVEQIPASICQCDWNSTDGLTVQDIFDFLASYFNNNGDFNSNDGTTIQDIFDFLNCYFSGCP